jgi:drug/metabolite transporter (DMT)-like permease
VVTAAVLGLIAFALEGRVLPQSYRGWAVLLGLALIAQVGGQGLLSVALGRLPAVFSSLVIFLEAIVAALIAWAAFNEPVSALQALGGLCILAGIFVARPREIAQHVSA